MDIEEIKIKMAWKGFCPESDMAGKKVRMRLNQWDFYESEATGLQIAVLPGIQAIIMNFRGGGKFRHSPKYADEIVNGEILCPQNTEAFPYSEPIEIFKKDEELRNFISKIRRQYDPKKTTSFLKPNVDGEILPGIE